MERDGAGDDDGARKGPGPMLGSVLLGLREHGFEVGERDDGRRMSVCDRRGRRAWIGYGPVMRFEPDAPRDAELAEELNAWLAALPDEYASARWLAVGLLDADLAWQLERFGVTPAAYVLALDAGLRDLPTIAARYGLPGPR